MKHSLLLLLLLLTPLSPSYSFSWEDLWVTKNHQAANLMKKGEFKQAEKTFSNPDWQAAAAFRAQDFKFSAARYASLKPTADSYYNEGNALAHLGRFNEAIKAYDHALAIAPKHEDALFNRKIMETLLKKQKENQDKQNQDKQDQNKQNQDKQDQDKQDQDKQDQDKQDQDKQDQDKQDQDKQDQDKQDQDKQDQDKQDQDKQDQDKQDNDKPQPVSETERENQEAQEQWLRLIPDDPGGLMREKFMRDHLRRANKEEYE
jgi:Ca-activated chloride channel homolog